ncbi:MULTISPECIES: YqaJ viral recombinase family protein [Aminobacterium]|jgi:putative phage-type endonuclease|uniref:YqaJ viral recombinase family nuclease n=1 Tax=Aminobacterium TaxID=81466 RepID=UPI002580E838|nr:YqaJ viral recombinase family protein [Aminobacterium sp. UBA4987]
MCKALVSTLGMSREDWLNERKKGLGGSDSPVIILGNDHPFSTPLDLWLEKTGQGVYVEETPDMKRGKMLEGLVADLYKAETGRNVRRVNSVLQHPEIPCMLANVDREIVGTDKGPGILEIKCPRARTFSKIMRTGLPEYYYIQLQHYLAVKGWSWGSLAVFSADNWQMRYFDIERDEALIDVLEATLPKWWKKHVIDGVAPEDARLDVDLPDVGGEGVYQSETPEWYFAVRGYLEAKELADEANEIMEAKRKTITDLMTQYGSSIVEGSGARVYWKEQKGRTSFDWKKYQKDHPELDLSSYFKTGQVSRPFRFYQIKGGLLSE